MHSLEEMGSNVPAFLAKLWRMVEDPETNEFISWSSNGNSFIIRNQARFSRELLPVYYKHNNLASFIRQLNMYGFHKVVSIEGGGLKVDKDEMEFAHSYFLMGHPYLLDHIKRKIPIKMEEGRTTHKPDLVTKVLSEVKTMKGRQDNVDSQLSAMKRENEVLWREVAMLRQKHLKQQQIVNKLIQFLVSMVQPSRNGGLGIKRHYPLMLGDRAHHDTTNKPNNKTKHHSNNLDSQDLGDVPNHLSPTGPVIHELEATDLPDECIENNTDDTVVSDFLSVDLGDATHGEVHSPASISSKGSAAVNMSEPNCDVLLELVEDYPLNPEILTTASPAEVNPCITSSKMKSKSTGVKNKKKKVGNKSVQIKKELSEAPEVDPIDVGKFLEIVLPNVDANIVPTLDPNDQTISLPDPINDLNSINMIVGENEQCSLDAATDAAISAISNVAAETVAMADDSGVPIENLPGDDVPEETAVADNVATGDASSNMTLACANSPGVHSIKSKEELDTHLGSLQSELDCLKDLLKGEGYSLDANTLLGLFSDDPTSFGFHIMDDTEENLPNKENKSTDPLVSGGELATYSSNLLDLVDIDSGLDEWPLPETETLENYASDLNTPQVLMVDNIEFPSPPPSKKRKK